MPLPKNLRLATHFFVMLQNAAVGPNSECLLIPIFLIQSTPSQEDAKSSVLTSSEASSVDPRSMASRRTAMGGALSLGLLSSNVDQLLSIATRQGLPASEYVKAGLIGFSILLQVQQFCKKLTFSLNATMLHF